MKPTQAIIDDTVVGARIFPSTVEHLVIVAQADRIHELERAAETARAEHAAALGLATARVRELKGEREELLGLLGASEFEEKCGRLMWGVQADECPDDAICPEHQRVARIEKATKETNITVDLYRCYECGRWWGVERGQSGQCPVCAGKAVGSANGRADRAERQMRGLRGALTRKAAKGGTTP